MLSSVQVRSMLESVARAHLAEARSAWPRWRRRTASLRTTVVRVTALWAGHEGFKLPRALWQQSGMAERQVLAANGLTQEEIDEVSWTLDLLRKSARGTFPRQRLLALLDACGAPQG